jgi:hypothetical protein
VQNAAAMLTRLCATLFLATTVAACVADAGSDEDTAAGGGKADGATPVLVFDDEWNETQTGRLLAGDKMRVQYDLDRLTDCRGSTGGSEVWGVTGYASFDGASPQTFAVSRLDAGTVQPVLATVDIPAGATRVAMWFAINNRWGCIAYDSNDSHNYVFEIEGGATGGVLSFNGDWSESQSDTIHAGDSVVIHYEPQRLLQYGYATWSVTGYWRVDGRTIKSLIVTRQSPGAALVPADPLITVPRGTDLEMWFSATNVSGCNAYDSNLSANYHFTIE